MVLMYRHCPAHICSFTCLHLTLQHAKVKWNSPVERVFVGFRRMFAAVKQTSGSSLFPKMFASLKKQLYSYVSVLEDAGLSEVSNVLRVSRAEIDGRGKQAQRCK